MRIVGSSKIFITLTIFIKYILIGAAGSFLGLWLIEYMGSTINGMINIPGIKISFLTKDIHTKIIFYGTLITVLSTFPSLFRLYTKGLNSD